MDLEKFMQGLAASQAALTQTVAGLAQAISQPTVQQPPAARQEVAANQLKQARENAAKIWKDQTNSWLRESVKYTDPLKVMAETFSHDPFDFYVSLAFSAKFGVFNARYFEKINRAQANIKSQEEKDTSYNERMIDENKRQQKEQGLLFYAALRLAEMEWQDAKRSNPERDYMYENDHILEEDDGKKEDHPGFSFMNESQLVGPRDPESMQKQLVRVGDITEKEYRDHEARKREKDRAKYETVKKSKEQMREEAEISAELTIGV